MKGSGWWVAGLIFAAQWMVSSAEAKVVVIPPRAGQLGVGLQGQYGSLTSGGGFGSEFGAGPGMSVRLRYRLRYERAFGVSFERQSFEVRELALGDSAQKTLTLMNSSVEFFQLFGTRTRTTRMLSVGFGLVQPSKKLRGGETKLGGDDVRDGAFVSLGAGLERFFYQSLGIDLNLHYQTIFQNGSTNHNVQAAAGLIFYTTY
ncbi:MAG: hypothetical protein ABIS67_12005 [Candidatus Eisenbacteria bacterium]